MASSGEQKKAEAEYARAAHGESTCSKTGGKDSIAEANLAQVNLVNLGGPSTTGQSRKELSIKPVDYLEIGRKLGVCQVDKEGEKPRGGGGGSQ